MGNTWTCTRRPRGMASSLMRGSSSAENVAAIATEGAPSSSMSLLGRPSMKSTADRVVHRMAVSGSETSSIEQRIDESRTHWSILAEPDEFYFDEEKVVEDNRKVFAALQSHPTRANFFHTFGYDTEVYPQSGSLVIGEKFAEGGQAELFHAKVTGWNPKYIEHDKLEKLEWVLKVFKKGTLLRQLQSQWPEGMFQYDAKRAQVPFKGGPRFSSDVQSGVLLEDGRFAFLMKKEMCDLRSLIDQGMKMVTGKNEGPFKKEDVEWMMFCIAVGMSWLHSHNIVHRDLKASNVLVRVYNSGDFECYVADYECSVGVVGTNFFRAPEILVACKDKSVGKRPELFTMSSDVYSYGMTCYEIVTGKLPFDNHPVNEYDIVLNGGGLEIPTYVDGWMQDILYRCWQANPSSRPSFGEISNLILANSKHVREFIEQRWYKLDEIDWIKWEM